MNINKHPHMKLYFDIYLDMQQCLDWGKTNFGYQFVSLNSCLKVIFKKNMIHMFIILGSL